MLEPLPGAECDWYLLLQMPEITTQYESGVHAMRNRLEEWMDALVTEGFRPMRLSEVRARLASGQKLPPRTVVLEILDGRRQAE